MLHNVHVSWHAWELSLDGHVCNVGSRGVFSSMQQTEVSLERVSPNKGSSTFRTFEVLAAMLRSNVSQFLRLR